MPLNGAPLNAGSAGPFYVRAACPILQENGLKVKAACPILQDGSMRVRASVAILQGNEGALFHSIIGGTYAPPAPEPPEETPPTPWFTPTQRAQYRQVPSATIRVEDLTTGESITITEGYQITYSTLVDQPAKWTIKLRDRDRLFVPFPAATGDGPKYQRLLKPYGNIDQYRAINRVWTITLDVDGAVWTSPYLVALEYSYDASPEDGYEVTISGIDCSRNLLLNNQSMRTWRSTTSHIVHASDVISRILDVFKIPNRILRFDDYPIRVLDFQAQQPISVIKQVLRIAGAHFRFTRGDTFEVYPRYTGANIHPAWTFTDSQNCHVLNYKYSQAAIYNEYQVRRTDATGGLIAEDEQEGEAGFKTITWSTPAVNLKFVAECRSGDFYDPTYPWMFYNGSLVADATGPATEFHFTFVPHIGSVAAPRTYWHIWIYGKTQTADPKFAGWSDNWAVRVRHADSYVNDGPLPAPEVEEDPLIPNRDWGIRVGKQDLADLLRLRETVALGTPLNPFIVAGDVVSINDTYGGITGLWCVDSHNWTLSEDEGTSSLETSKYVPTDTIGTGPTPPVVP